MKKKSKTEILSLPDIRMYLKLTVIESSAELARRQANRTDSPRNSPTHCGSVMHSRCGTADPGEKEGTFDNVAKTADYPHGETKSWTRTPIIHKNQCQGGINPKGKRSKYKSFSRK